MPSQEEIEKVVRREFRKKGINVDKVKTYEQAFRTGTTVAAVKKIPGHEDPLVQEMYLNGGFDASSTDIVTVAKSGAEKFTNSLGEYFQHKDRIVEYRIDDIVWVKCCHCKEEVEVSNYITDNSRREKVAIHTRMDPFDESNRTAPIDYEVYDHITEALTEWDTSVMVMYLLAKIDRECECRTLYGDWTDRKF